jgi:hypothetical protein
VITLNSGESILFRNPNSTVYKLAMATNVVKTSDEYEVGGNIIQLFYPGVELPALAFKNAFENDELIVSASVLKLPATALAEYCYGSMFSGCTSLTAITCLASSGIESATGDWLDSVSETGTFTKAAGVEWPTGTSGIPDGWTVIEQ